MSQKSILVVDDHKSFREALAFDIEMLGFKADFAEDGQDGYEKAKLIPYSLIISDIRMPNWDGIKLLLEIRKLSPSHPPVILMTGFADISIQTAFEMGVDAFIGKPVNLNELAKTINILLLPLKDQLKQNIDEKPIYQIKGPGKYYEVGRRGLFLGSNVDPTKHKVGEFISFELIFIDATFPFQNLRGTGYIRWIRIHEEEGHIPGIGVEISHLEEENVEPFLQYVGSKEIIATIPNGMHH
jgi:DNA-binding response OmpR family regulator